MGSLVISYEGELNPGPMPTSLQMQPLRPIRYPDGMNLCASRDQIPCFLQKTKVRIFDFCAQWSVKHPDHPGMFSDKKKGQGFHNRKAHANPEVNTISRYDDPQAVLQDQTVSGTPESHFTLNATGRHVEQDTPA